MKTIRVSPVVYEMLLVLSKKHRLKPEDWLEKMIRQEYSKISK